MTARVVISRFKALLVEPSALVYAQRHDNIEAVYKKPSERRSTADVSGLLKVLHRIVNQVIAAHGAGGDQANGLTVDLSLIDMETLRDEFAQKGKRKATPPYTPDDKAQVARLVYRHIWQQSVRDQMSWAG